MNEDERKTIADRLRDSVKKGANFELLYGSNDSLNTAIERALLPCAFFNLVQDSTIVSEGNQLKERANFMVYFVDYADANNPLGSYENEQVIDKMKEKAMRWALSLRGVENESGLKLVSVNSAQRVYDKYDAWVTGYGLQVTLEEETGIYNCYHK